MGLNVKGLILGIVSYQLAGVSDPETKRKIIGRVLLKF
jgi:GMP synthase PP-ATPase subunit